MNYLEIMFEISTFVALCEDKIGTPVEGEGMVILLEKKEKRTNICSAYRSSNSRTQFPAKGA